MCVSHSNISFVHLIMQLHHRDNSIHGYPCCSQKVSLLTTNFFSEHSHVLVDDTRRDMPAVAPGISRHISSSTRRAAKLVSTIVGSLASTKRTCHGIKHDRAHTLHLWRLIGTFTDKVAWFPDALQYRRLKDVAANRKARGSISCRDRNKYMYAS